MKKLLIIMSALLVASTLAQAKVSIGDTNLKVIAPGKKLYAETYSGGPNAVAGINSSGVL